MGFGLGFDAAIFGAGYIVGIEVALSVLAGTILSWQIGIPLFGYYYGIPENVSASTAAMTIWAEHLRFVGVGTMLVGGSYAIVSLLKPIARGIKSSIHSGRN